MAVLIAVEGIDGSGKGTQVARLKDQLESEGRSVAMWTFPQYDRNRFGQLIGRFLNGQYGSLEQVHPQLSALLFSGDRFESRPALLQTLEQNDVVLLDRYVASNIAHQAGRLKGEARQELTEFLLWLEFDLYQMPRPDRTFWLDLSVMIAQERIRMKAARSYTDREADLQEEDSEHLQAASEVYAALSSQPGWTRIECGHKPPEALSAELRNGLSDLFA